jgi:hypothetical protein
MYVVTTVADDFTSSHPDKLRLIIYIYIWDCFSDAMSNMNIVLVIVNEETIQMQCTANRETINQTQS